MNGPTRTYDWPSLMVDEWTATRDTLHMWVQIVGKIRMVHMPLFNHWWEVTLYVSPRGLTTGAVPCRDAVFDMEFDFVNQILAIRKSDGRQEAVPLAAKPVAEFYGETLSALDRLDIETRIVGKPQRVRHPLSRLLRTISTLNTTLMRRTRSGSNWCRPTAL